MKTEYAVTLTNAVRKYGKAARGEQRALLELGAVVEQRPAKQTVASLLEWLPLEVRGMLPATTRGAEGVLSKAATVWREYFRETGIPKVVRHSVRKLYNHRPSVTEREPASILADKTLPEKPAGSSSGKAKAKQQPKRDDGRVSLELEQGTVAMLERYMETEGIPTMTGAIQRLITRELERKERTATGKARRAARKRATATA